MSARVSAAGWRLHSTLSFAAIGACGWLFACAPEVNNSIPAAVPQTVAETAPTSPVIWPTSGWQTSTPEAQGIDSATLAAALETIRAERIPVHSLLIERHGHVVLDTYFYPYAPDQPHNVYSVTKSVTSTLIGIAMREHQLDDVNVPVFSLLPQRSSDPRKAHLTLAHLLSMTSGLDCSARGGHNLLQQMMASRNWPQFVIDRPLASEPGSTFDYCAGNTELVSAVLTEKTGASASDYAQRQLFGPLGIAHATWPTAADHVSHGWSDLQLTPRDMAKLGYLWLHNGRWEDRQIISESYLAEALATHANVEPGINYGYGLWLYPNHVPADFEANGTGGQRITVIPSLDMVEVVTGGGLDANAVAALIATAPKSDSPLPENSAAAARLDSLATEAALSPGRTGSRVALHVSQPSRPSSVKS
ncbi:MAG TPA: serine hydrolase [Rhizomicrobium sp.]|jgi:CubicO group peptidase (beta-lactamase class C family)